MPTYVPGVPGKGPVHSPETGLSTDATHRITNALTQRMRRNSSEIGEKERALERRHERQCTTCSKARPRPRQSKTDLARTTQKSRRRSKSLRLLKRAPKKRGSRSRSQIGKNEHLRRKKVKMVSRARTHRTKNAQPCTATDLGKKYARHNVLSHADA